MNRGSPGPETFLPFARHHAPRQVARRRTTALLGAVVCLVIANGCIKTPPPPEVNCKYDSDCATGRCLAGLCIVAEVDAAGGDQQGDASADVGIDAADAIVDAQTDVAIAGDVTAEVDTASETDAKTDASETDVVAPCSNDESCLGKLGGLPACAYAACSDGVCVPAVLPNETTCVSDGVCPAPGDCESGACVVGGPPCDDQESCTADQCTTGGCNHLPFKNGTPCAVGSLTCLTGACGGGSCKGILLPGQCLIDDTCWAAGSAQPGAPCWRCDPSISTTTWSLVTAVACNDNNACTAGDTCDLAGACTSTALLCDDGNPCTDDSCNVASGCTALPNSATCVSDDLCATAGICKSGSCTGTGTKDCDDANPCTQDQCQPSLGCAHSAVTAPCSADTDPCTQDVCLSGTCIGVPLSSVCKISGMCVPAGGKADGNDCLLCDPVKNPTNWTPTAGSPCDDANACTFFDVCIADQCVGQVGPCDDKNPCTTDSCAPESGCIFAATDGPCDDLSKCTLGDACTAGKCSGTPIGAKDCADGNACTDDTCVPAVGCSHTPNGAACDDGNSCTVGDKCNAGICLSGSVQCPCTLDTDCNDANPCTLDHCTAQGTCVNDILGPIVSCNDGNACTKLDTCATGFCKGLPVNCDDGNVCTTNGCVAETGCTSLPTSNIACNDANACTSGDLCVGGACTGTAKNCDDGNPCTIDQCGPKTGVCGHVALADGASCPSDSVACTIDQCIGANCTHDAIEAGSCLIAGACLAAGTIHPAQNCLGCQPTLSPHDWSPLTGQLCSDGSACTQGDTCLAGNQCVGSPVVCEDNNPCTVNGCNPLAAGPPCLYIATGGACSDGSACTHDDSCQIGLCGGVTTTCDDANPCTLDQCDPKSGCTTAAVTAETACPSDGLPCTADLCSGGLCSHTPLPGTCAIAQACLSEGEMAPLPACHACITAVSQTSWSTVDGPACSDGDPCTGSDACIDGSCVGLWGLPCDDKNPCTLDGCTPGSGACTHTATAGPCDDANLCTTSDTCSGGACIGGPALACDPGPLSSDCTAVVCDPAIGCSITTTCGPLHGCLAGLCVSLGQDGMPGPAPLPSSAQMLLPSVRWQAQHDGPMGSLPQLWIAAQVSLCDPASTTFSHVALTLLPPGAATPQVADLSVDAGSCATEPVLLAHPSTASDLVLAWLEGGAQQSICSIAPQGGRVRLGLVGHGTDSTLIGPPSSCPDSGAAPLLSQPVVQLLPTADPNVGALTGLLVRATALGPLAWTGPYSQAWGGAGSLLASGAMAGYVGAPVPSRQALAWWPGGGAILSPASFAKVGSQTLAAINFVALDAAAQPANVATTLGGGIDLGGAAVEFRAVSAVWDGDAARIGVLVSGTAHDAGNTLGFLAFRRAGPGAPALVAAKVIATFAAPNGFVGVPVIHAARMSDLPGSVDFLVAFALPGTSALQMMRVHPIDDALSTVGATTTIATNFASQWSGATVTGYGGLSELLVDGAGKRYTLVYESTSGLSILTAPIPP